MVAWMSGRASFKLLELELTPLLDCAVLKHWFYLAWMLDDLVVMQVLDCRRPTIIHQPFSPLSPPIIPKYCPVAPAVPPASIQPLFDSKSGRQDTQISVPQPWQRERRRRSEFRRKSTTLQRLFVWRSTKIPPIR